jgi:hypothetical protein
MKVNVRFFVALFALTAIAALAFLIRGSLNERKVAAAEANPEAGEDAEKSSGLSPLVVDTGAPLLLNEPVETESPSFEKTAEAIADNSACFVCHANYAEEPLARDHAKAGIGCLDCHGDSFPHRNDENNTTPPDIIYPADRIAPSCRECHATHDVPAVEVIALYLKRCPSKRDPTKVLCTDCHGEHRLEVRTVRWDKETRKLITGSGEPLEH